MKIARWGDRILKDHLKKEFIPLKVLYFLLYGGMTSLFPFLTIQARSLGITVDELGIIYSLLPIMGIFAPTLAGLFADKIGDFKKYLAFMVSCSGLASLLFLAIPYSRVYYELPGDLPVLLKCSSNYSRIIISEPFTCDYKNISEIEITAKKCKYHCNNGEVDYELGFVSLKERWCSSTENCFAPKNETSSSFQNNIFIKTKLKQTSSATEIVLDEQFCPDFKKMINVTNNYYSYNSDDDNCRLQCDSITHSDVLCENKKSVKIFTPWVTMLSYIIVRLLNAFTLSASFPLFDGAVIAVIKEHKGDLGLQRMYGNLGMIVMTPISGKLIDVFSTISGKEDFRPAFYMYCVIKFICTGVILFINLEFKKPSKTVIKDFKALMKNPRVSCFMLFTFVSGTCFGFIETFLFWLLEDLGADKSLMGITVTVGALFGIPILMLSSFVIKKLGHIPTLIFTMIILVVRLLGYAFIPTAWAAMPFEALEGFTNSLQHVASVSYSGVLASPSIVASLQGLYGGTYHGVGRGAGSLIGGFLTKSIGISNTFCILAASCAIVVVIYTAVYWLIFRAGDIAKEDVESKDYKEKPEGVNTEVDNKIEIKDHQKETIQKL